MDITPLIPQGRQVIERYGGGAFTVTQQEYRGSLWVFPDAAFPWEISQWETVTVEALLQGAAQSGMLPELLLIGTGERLRTLPPEWRRRLRDAGLAAESMDTGAACRTYNVLLAEGRRAAAALIAV